MPAKKQRKMGEKRTCPECKKNFTWREKKSKHNTYCSIECAAKQAKQNSGRPLIIQFDESILEDA
ncbi:MAG: hypothetical protein ACRCXZ_06720, partial [Patescibacteria group bacterium]